MQDANEQLRPLRPRPNGLDADSAALQSPSCHNNNDDYGTTNVAQLVTEHGARQVGFPTDDGSIQHGVVDAASDKESPNRVMTTFTIVAILSTSFSYGCILTTLFIIILPIECERIELSHVAPKSVALGIFVAIAGFTQLVSPLVGRASDTFEPPMLNGDQQLAELGQRLPYFMFGAAFAVTGLLCQMCTSYAALWVRYGFSFVFTMVGLNIQYAMMFALIPDQVPRSQTGVANGILALLLVTGSIFGFGLFHLFMLEDDIGSMYGLYASMVILTSILTGSYAHDRDAELAAQRMEFRSLRASGIRAGGVESPTDDDSSAGSIVSPSQPKNWHKDASRATKKAVKKAVKKAQEIVITPALIGSSMVRPFRRMNWSSVLSCYTIDYVKFHDFSIVTLSRLFYYCGMSVQTFFLYFVHDIIHVRKNPEAAVAIFAILGQCTGALTCYPVGIISDRLLGGRRTPFVYASCAILSAATLTLVFTTTFHQMCILSLILGAANGAYLTAETSMAVDALPSELENDGEYGSAQLMGVWGVAAFLGSALGPMIGGPLLYIFGARPSTDDDDTPQPTNEGDDVLEEYSLRGYAVVFSLSSFYFLCSAFTVSFLNGRPNK